MRFTTSDAAEFSGASYAQIHRWDEHDVLAPSIRRANGSGSRRAYSIDDVVIATALVHAVHFGLTIEALTRISGYLRAVFVRHGEFPVEVAVGPDGEILDPDEADAALILRPFRYATALAAEVVPLPASV